MPVYLRPNELFVKNPNGSGYLPQNVISETSTAEMLAAFDETIANTQESLNAITAEAQTAVDGIESQKNTMIASIASVAGQGTDTTLTQSGVAADAKAAGELKNVFKDADIEIATWESGYFNLTSSATSVDTASRTSSSTYVSAIMSCELGDVFIITSTGASAGRNWGLLSAASGDGNIIARKTSPYTSDGEVLLARATSTYAVFNANKNETHSVIRIRAYKKALMINSNFIGAITSGSSLNDFTTAGNYKITTNAIAQEVTHLPEGVAVAGKLVVMNLQSASVIMQIYITNRCESYFRRGVISTTTEWTEWKRFINETDLFDFNRVTDAVLNPVAGLLTFEQGRFDSATGETANSNDVIRTTDFIPEDVVRISCSSSYKFILWIWDKSDGSYIGHRMSDGTYGTNTSYLYETDHILDWESGYKYKITFYNEDGSGILPAAGSNCVTWTTTDSTLTKPGKAADAKAVGDEINDIYQYVKDRQEVSILFIGNSLTQDGIAYLPYLLKHYYPEVHFRFYMWYHGGWTLTEHYDDFTNNRVAKTFSVAENSDSWTNYSESKTMSWVLANHTFDMVCLQGYYNYEPPTKPLDNVAAFNNVRNYIQTNYTGGNGLEFITLFHAPLRSDAATVFDRVKQWNATFLQETVAQDMIPIGIAVYRALSTDLDSLGDQGHLSPDGTHTQEGLPCLLQTYTVLCWLLDKLSVNKSVYGFPFKMTTDIYSTIHVPGPNLGTGVIEGTTAQNLLAQEVAIQAYKEGKSFVNKNIYVEPSN